MNCTYFQIIAHEVARETTMDTASWNDAVAHAAGCPECARWLADARSLAADMGALSRASGREQAPPALEAKLIEAFRDEQKARSTWRRRRRWAEWAIAAAAVLALAGVAVIRRHDMLRRRDLGATTVHPSPRIAQAPPVATPNAERPATSEARVLAPARDVGAQARNSGPPQARANIPEVATDFLPLPGAAGAENLDSGELVRVELPRLALAYLGFPVGSGDGTVTADVLIGENGLAQAVRFVQ